MTPLAQLPPGLWRHIISQTRTGKQETPLSAEEVFLKVKPLLNGRLLQIGGDATTGRSLVVAKVVAKETQGKE